MHFHYHLFMLKLLTRLTFISIVFLYLVILAGGIVRMSGSGMGCPDWPKCFGQYIPPTDISQIPENYKEIYAEKRFAKNEKLAGILRAFGNDSLAEKLLTDENMYVEEDFNPIKTYVEYINRLLGALAGLFLFFTLLVSLFFMKTKPLYFVLSIILVLVTAFQAWLGSIVVSTNLLPGMITLHMMLALVIIALALALYSFVAKTPDFKWQGKFRIIQVPILVALIITIFQIVFGTQVRQEIDFLNHYLNIERGAWIENLSGNFKIHRTIAWLVIASNAYILYRLRNSIREYKLLILLPALIIIEALSGIYMAHIEVAPIMQPIHLFAASLIFGTQFFILLRSRI